MEHALRGWTNDDAKRFLEALGLSPETLGDQAIYQRFLTYEHLPEAFLQTVRGRLEHLGFDPDDVASIRLPLLDPEFKEAMHTLVGAYRRGLEDHINAAVKKLVGEQTLPLQPDYILPELIQEAEEEFGHYLNHAGRYSRHMGQETGDSAGWAEIFSRSTLATFNAMRIITGKCGLAETPTLHPVMEQVKAGEISVPVTVGATGRHH